MPCRPAEARGSEMTRPSPTNTPAPSRASLPLGERVTQVLSLAYRARRAALLEGPTGIGKSEIVREAAARLGVALAVLDLSLLEPPDLVGLPVIEDGRTRYASPSILPEGGAGILLLEELNRAPRYIQQPALQLLTARALHEYRLPDGWVCFAAINPQDGSYQVTPLDPALSARFLHLSVRADRGAWLSWAHEHEVHAAVTAVVRAHDRALDDVCPRTWVYVSQLLATLTPTEARDETLLRDALGGYLPGAWLEALLSRRELADSGLGLDVRAMLVRGQAHERALASLDAASRAGRTDLFDELAHRLEAPLSGPEAGVLAASGKLDFAALDALFTRLPGDHRERLQRALADNPTMLPFAEPRPRELLQNFANSRADALVSGFVREPSKQHRLGLCIRALSAHLDDPERRGDARKSTPARVSLGHLLSRVGAAGPSPWALELVDALKRAGITPVRPA